MLDESFTFYFDPVDVYGEIPESWFRSHEMGTTEAPTGGSIKALYR